jgi:hypothetical protein
MLEFTALSPFQLLLTFVSNVFLQMHRKVGAVKQESVTKRLCNSWFDAKYHLRQHLKLQNWEL